MVKRFAGSAPVVCIVFLLLLFVGSAGAAAPAPGWSVDTLALPSTFSAGAGDEYVVTATNVGSEPTDGSPVTITDTLPAGLTVQSIAFIYSHVHPNYTNNIDFAPYGLCSTVPLRCTLPGFVEGFGAVSVAPGGSLEMIVEVAASEPGITDALTDTATVSGGGGGSASGSVRNQFGSPALFGVGSFSALFAGVDGAPDTQAGGHPEVFKTTIALNSEIKETQERQSLPTSVHDIKDTVIDLPVGFAGSALAAPQCTLAQLASEDHCPPDTAIGNIYIEPKNGSLSVESAIWNLTPERGVPAEFGFIDTTRGSHVLYASVVRTPAGYVLRTTAPDIPQITLAHIHVLFNGDPARADGTTNSPVALFTNPSDCTAESLVTSFHADSWQAPGRTGADGTPDFSDPNWAGSTTESPPVTGCNLLHFDASITARPDTTVAGSPSGLDFELRVPQNEDPSTLATPPLRKAVVTLPAGLVVNPSVAGGLATCSLAQIGLEDNSQPSCPEASKIGTLEAESPAIGGVLQGSVYQAAQSENPFHSLVALYMVVDDPTTGVLIKIPGRIDPDPVTGQLTTTFDDLPQFQVSDLKLHLFGGPRGPLVTPSACGTYTTSTSLTPWSAPDSGPPATPEDSFQINTGCGGGFAPSFTAGTVNNQAGGFTPFTATFSRSDQDQNISGVSVKAPPGLLGILKGVTQCPEPQANQGMCGQGSLIGHTTVAAGAGPNPFYVQGGQVFLTGPYKGAPFGLSIVVPAVAGPFNLGNVVVRAAINVDPHTAQITVVSDPLPTILQGIPLDVRTVNVTIDRQGFIFNPTSCDPLTVGGSLTSTQGATAQVSSRFQAANCANLGFKPSFTVSTQANTSKKNGASLDVKVAYPQGAYTEGHRQANIRSVAVTLPKALPSRLSTIQQACPEAMFKANPASCPAGSNIGIGTARTPVLANPVVGPAYLVSHGGAAFPDLVLILQGEGVTLELIGSINIKKSITSSTFASIPDAPISSFELKLPAGPHSGLAAVLPAKAKGNLCGTSLAMPTTLTGQNGAQLKQNAKIQVTGCAKAKKKAKAKRRKKKGK